MRAQHLDEVAFLDLKRRRSHRGRRYRYVIKPAMSFDLRLRQRWGWGYGVLLFLSRQLRHIRDIKGLFTPFLCRLIMHVEGGAIYP